MDVKLIAIIAQEVGRITTEILKVVPLRQRSPLPSDSKITLEESPPSSPEQTQEQLTEKATSIEAGCVPCALGHLSTCSGLLNEAMRFAKKDGVGSGEVIDRMNMCLDELNAMERVDLRPEMITSLPKWEKSLANSVLTESRQMRHQLEGISSTEDLERVAGNTQTVRRQIGRDWFQEKLARKEKD